jgi:hypothetical protein
MVLLNKKHLVLDRDVYDNSVRWTSTETVSFLNNASHRVLLVASQRNETFSTSGCVKVFSQGLKMFANKKRLQNKA